MEELKKISSDNLVKLIAVFEFEFTIVMERGKCSLHDEIQKRKVGTFILTNHNSYELL